MEDNNLLDYNQHLLIKRAPTLITGPSLVFLAPTKKGLKSLILKCKQSYGSVAQPTSALHINLCSSLCWSTLLINLWSICSSISSQSIHHCCSSISAHELCSSLLVILFCSLILLVNLVNLFMYTSLYTSSYTIIEQVIML